MKDGKITTKNKIIAVVFMVALVTVAFSLSLNFGYFVLCTLVFGSVMTWVMFRYLKDAFEEEEKEEETICDVADLDDFKRIVNLPIPFAIIDTDKTVTQYNNRFGQLFEDEITGHSIEEFLPDFDVEVPQKTISIKGCFYDVYCSKINDETEDKFVYSVCLVDEDEREKVKIEKARDRTVVGLLSIDNYEEVVETVDDFHFSMLTANIDKKLSDYVLGTGGIIKKLEKDRYLLVVSMETLEKEKNRKFDILNGIREIKVNEMPVTMSMGIGVSDSTLSECMKSAREALDLALGRGGDQVLVKENNKYLFFGGKSGEVSHNAKVRARVKAEALEIMIADADRVLVMGHKVPDFDAIGAAIGIYRIATDLGKKSNIVLDNPTKGIARLYDTLTEISEYNDLFITGERAQEVLKESKTLLIVVDTYVSYLVENEEVLEKAKDVVVFDHHRKSADYIEKALLTYHEPYASSVCELVTEVIRNLGEKVKIKPVEADALLAGISVDTKNFGIKAGAVTFESAAYLRRHGADTARVKQLFKNDFEVIKSKSITVGNATLYRDVLAISVCDYDKDDANIVSASAADELLNIMGVRAAIVVYRVFGDSINVSARSYGDINVQVLLEKIGGGGHQTMAGVALKNVTIEEAIEKLKGAVDEYFEEEE